MNHPISNNIISPNEAGLLLHKFVTEAVPVMAYFRTADETVTAKFNGFILSFTKFKGLVVGLDSPLSNPVHLNVWMTFAHDLVARSHFTYADETEMPEQSNFGSGLRIHFPNGDSLTIIEEKH